MTNPRTRTLLFSPGSGGQSCSSLLTTDQSSMSKDRDALTNAGQQQATVAALESVGLSDRMHHLPSEMSGGQQQRVAVARAIVTNPALILADEPTGNLDTASSVDVMEIFRRVNAEHRTVVLTTHEEDIAAYAKRVVRLRDGVVLSDDRRAPIDAPPRSPVAPRRRSATA